ncbi:uncharacterized protein CC84DRAFT_1204955 [Paraphaeosphaeria sporulosa]|uniref:Uncharacterized protein n=1 Tax=Paraphaeosphaeria sporulosa TaxID=1460663 RepID=A0A177CKJ5_9PLEO|nr:uncharacterized protein CC84DRAFT_1204955 [Paraphaeosphaeria sporulosa]OAG07482.1 hypothetical protein CC84DRAFT_1204955 [Paraphaeosphaeria sporulosa]
MSVTLSSATDSTIDAAPSTHARNKPGTVERPGIPGLGRVRTEFLEHVDLSVEQREQLWQVCVRGLPDSPHDEGVLETHHPSTSEIYNALLPDGMPIKKLVHKFRICVNQDNKKEFVRLVRAVASYDKGRGWLNPLPKLPSDEQIAAADKRHNERRGTAAIE